MKRIHIEGAAEQELETILAYIAEKGDAVTALRFVQRIRVVINSIPEMPKAGNPREDLLPNVRQRIVGRYLVFYEELEDIINILHVVHGARHLPAVFGLEPQLQYDD